MNTVSTEGNCNLLSQVLDRSPLLYEVAVHCRKCWTGHRYCTKLQFTVASAGQVTATVRSCSSLSQVLDRSPLLYANSEQDLSNSTVRILNGIDNAS
uniref:Uncharacterized protein n=1 Tax=Setaria digitata TaxID=48799 RepID=A0A915PRR7_9BILA